MARILVADDDAAALTAIRRQLEEAGHEVLMATDGRTAFDLYAAAPVDLVIVDIFMPQMDGIELTMRLKQRAPGARILVMSGGGTVGREEALEVALRVGATRTLAKPYTREELLQIVQEVLGDDPVERLQSK